MATKKAAPTPISETPSDELVLKRLTVNSFGGISKEHPVVVHFPPGKRIGKASGNQGAGKSSTINALLYACGKEFDFKLENFVNIQDGTIDIEQEFEKNGRKYMVKASKNKFTLKKLYRDGDDERWIDESSPKETLAKLIGHVATSPMFLKTANGDAQIKWLYEVLKVPDEVKAKETKIKAALAEATLARTEANRDYERIKAALSEEPLYATWEENGKRFSNYHGSPEFAKQKLEEASVAMQRYQAAEIEVGTLKKQIKADHSRIEEIEAELEALKKQTTALEKKAVATQNTLALNESVKDRHKKALDEYLNLSKYEMERKTWELVKRRKAGMDEFETVVQRLDTQKSERSKELKELVKSLLPDVPGLEVFTEDSIDGAQRRGFKVFKKTPAQLSESELFEFYFQMCMAQGVSLVVIENISSFGTSAIDTLNQMAKHGVVVFATEMDRKKQALEITFIDELK